jgi:MFS family permease
MEPSVLVNDLILEFGITSSIAGFVISFAYIPYVFMQVPCGAIVDKFGLKIIISLGCLLCSLGAFVFGAATSVWQLEVGRFLIGLASASGFVCCGKVAKDYYSDPKKYKSIMAIAHMYGAVGGILGAVLTVSLTSQIGWRNTTYIIAAIGILIFILAILGIKEKKIDTTIKIRNIFTEFKIVIRNPTIWLIGLYGAMMELPMTAIAELWGVPFMEQRFGVSTDIASITSVTIIIAFGLGGFVPAWFSKKINYKNIMIIFAVGGLLSFIPAIYFDNIMFNTCIVLLFLMGIFSGTNVLCFWIASDIVPKEFNGTVSGLINMLIMSSGIIFQPFLGRLLDFFRKGLVNEFGKPIYNLIMYRNTFAFIGLGITIAIITPFIIKPMKSQNFSSTS